MRTAVLIVGPLVVLGGAFYWFMLRDRPDLYVDQQAADAATRPAVRRIVPTTVPTPETGSSVIGSSRNVYFQNLDPRDGRLKNEFRSERFDPRQDGAVDVIKPEARFYSGNGGVVTLEGSTGRVAVSQTGDRTDPNAVGTSSPTEGELKDVVIKFYEDGLDGDVTLTVHVPAIRFDAIANRISTIDSVIDGEGFLAEQVPITVRGRDFEFDGRGLTMQWNDREGRLDNLEIHRGDRLLVKNVERFGGAGLSAAIPALPPQASPVRTAFSLHPAQLLAGLVAVEQPAPRKQRADFYHATFDKDVRVVRDGVELAAAEVLRVVLPLGNAEAKPNPEAPIRPAPRPTTKETEPATPPATRPAVKAPPATQPAQAAPIEVRWTGKLTLRPAVLVKDVAPDEKMVELTGSPAWVQENDARVEARTIRVEPDAGRVRIEPGGPVRAISVRDPGGAEMRSRSPLFIDRPAGTAEVTGGGVLTTPATAGQSSTTVSWSTRLRAEFGEGEQPALQRILIEGDAAVRSDQFGMTSQTLTLAFAPPTDVKKARPAGDNASQFALPTPDLSLLRAIDATGDARLEVGEDDARRTLASESIRLGLVAGDQPDSVAITSITGNGNVSLVDAAGLDLSCGSLEVETRPIAMGLQGGPTPPAQTDDSLDAILRLVATEHVRLKQADGSRGSGDRLELLGDADARRMVLTGTPAVVAAERGALEGERIELDPANGNVNVPTPGKFVGANPQQPSESMAIAWAESMNTDGNTGICTLVGGVTLDGSNPDGTQLKASARRGVIHFATRQNAPATESTAESTTRPADPATAGVTLDSIRSLQLADEVDILMDAQGERTSSIQTDELNIDLEAGIVTAPRPGRMLLIDQRKPEPATHPATAPANRTGPGTLALAWKENLVWKMRDGDLTISGNVRLGFEREGSDDPIRITCQQIVCGLAPIADGKGAEQLAQRVELRSISARRNVSVRSKQASFDSATLSFDALTNRATATGDAETPVEVFDSDATSRVGFSAITWNLDTGMIEDFRDIDGRLRR